jgi:7,8-dihydro-6-hydroxymethylpterin-pyrophosphokinase
VSATPYPLAWKEAYINHVAKVKTSIPSERLLVIPMLGEQNPVAISKVGGCTTS